MTAHKLLILIINSCKKTTELIDKQAFITLTITEKMQLRMHKLLCNTCRAYENQSKFIEVVIGKWFTGNSKVKVKLSQESKTKIIDKIKKL
jgi:hypothetical protein